MVLLSLTSKLNKVAAPFFLRHGLSLRYALGRGVIRDNPTLDAMLLLPLCQKLIALEIQQEAATAKTTPSALDKLANDTFDTMFGKDGTTDGTGQTPPPQQNPHMEALERYLRPVLVPNEEWRDVTRWMFHTRFLKFARSELLVAQHGAALRAALDKYPKLRRGPQISTAASTIKILLGAEQDKAKAELKSVTLPTTQSIIRAFRMQSWNRKKDPDAIWNRMEELASSLDGEVVSIPGTSLRVADIDPGASTADLSIEDILELSGGHVASCGPFNVLCEECEIFQFWTKEYIQELGEYLIKRQREGCSSTLVLDVGSGDGLLAQLLREEFHNRTYLEGSSMYKKVEMPQVIAIDNGSWKIRTVSDVQKADATSIQQYTEEYDHVICLCSWMPMGQDWTAAFRDAGVDEYILIGEYDDGNCGDNWETWGNAEFRREDDDRRHTPHKSDGYKRFNLTSLSQQHGFSRFDSADSANSMTVSFRKQI